MIQSNNQSFGVVAMWAVSIVVGAFGLSMNVTAQDSVAESRESPTALNGLDPVSLVGGAEIAGDPDRTITHAGFSYQFASDDNQRQFQREPKRFEIQREGNCGVMPGVPGNPGLFAVVRGEIFIFGSPNCRTTFVADPDRYLRPRRNVAIFIHEGVELLDFAGPAEVFAAADQGRAFDVYTVAADPTEIVSQGFLTVKPEYTLDNCPKPDLIVLPGGNTGIPLRDDRVLAWIRSHASDTEVIMSVCTGAFLLAKAGLLDGQEATTHWGSIDSLKQAAPKTKVHSDRRVVDNGRIVTCAGVSAGIDGALHVVRRLLGDDPARQTARYMEYHWDGGESD